ncbi:MAG: caspase family protein [Candidatus Competibacter sp.]|nr:caspase family protein [Candidatus Competibacter sp.]
MSRIRWWEGGGLLVIGLLLLSGGRVAVAEKVALVIGNGGYAERPLRRPVQDAQDMAALLKTLGFAVTVATDLDLGQMEDQIRAFIASARLVPVRLFYYSGHGANYQDHSYLLPVDHGINRAYDMKRKAYPLDALLDGLREDAPDGINVVLLDACRDEPFGSQSKSVGGSKGLIPLATAGSGTLVAYAAGAGEQAVELAGDRNSLFTKHLLRRLKQPEDLRQVLTEVRAAVKAENPAQVTETSDKLVQALYLAGTGPVSPAPASATASTPPPPAVDHDREVWQSAEKCGMAACFRAYLEDYPKGRYARMAKARLELEPDTQPAVVTERPAPAARRTHQRFTDNGDGTVTDNNSGLIWLKDANCFDDKDWSTAMDLAKRLKKGQCGLRDGSDAGQWRLPSKEEWETLIDPNARDPALPTNYPFIDIRSGRFWSSTTYFVGSAWSMHIYDGTVGAYIKINTALVWPVRDGR